MATSFHVSPGKAKPGIGSGTRVASERTRALSQPIFIHLKRSFILSFIHKTRPLRLPPSVASSRWLSLTGAASFCTETQIRGLTNTHTPTHILLLLPPLLAPLELLPQPLLLIGHSQQPDTVVGKLHNEPALGDKLAAQPTTEEA